MEQGYRHEYKFLIGPDSAQLLKCRLAGVMERDPHAGKIGRYTIRSLYFDDPGFAAVEDKLSGISDRVKYRIRCYDGKSDFLRLEKKEKHRDLTRKTGQTLTVEQVQGLCSGTMPAIWEGLLGELSLGVAGGLRPAVLVEYDRTPFVCALGQTRITLDENIRTKPYSTELFDRSAMLPALEPGQVVLEVKFNDFLPGYLAQLLEDIPKIHLAVSKYVLCANLI